MKRIIDYARRSRKTQQEDQELPDHPTTGYIAHTATPEAYDEEWEFVGSDYGDNISPEIEPLSDKSEWTLGYLDDKPVPWKPMNETVDVADSWSLPTARVFLENTNDEKSLVVTGEETCPKDSSAEQESERAASSSPVSAPHCELTSPIPGLEEPCQHKTHPTRPLTWCSREENWLSADELAHTHLSILESKEARPTVHSSEEKSERATSPSPNNVPDRELTPAIPGLEEPCRHMNHPTRPLTWCFEEERWLYPSEFPHPHLSLDRTAHAVRPHVRSKGYEAYLAGKALEAQDKDQDDAQDDAQDDSQDKALPVPNDAHRHIKHPTRPLHWCFEEERWIWPGEPPHPHKAMDRITLLPEPSFTPQAYEAYLARKTLEAQDDAARGSSSEAFQTPERPASRSGTYEAYLARKALESRDEALRASSPRVLQASATVDNDASAREPSPVLKDNKGLAESMSWIARIADEERTGTPHSVVFEKSIIVADAIGEELWESPRWKHHDHGTFLDDEVESLDLSRYENFSLSPRTNNSSDAISLGLTKRESLGQAFISNDKYPFPGYGPKSESSNRPPADTEHTPPGSKRWETDRKERAHLDPKDRAFLEARLLSLHLDHLDHLRSPDPSASDQEQTDPVDRLNIVGDIASQTSTQTNPVMFTPASTQNNPAMFTPGPIPYKALRDRMEVLEDATRTVTTRQTSQASALETSTAKQTVQIQTLEALTTQVTHIRDSLANVFGGSESPVHELRKRYKHSRAEVKKLTVQVKELEQQQRDDVAMLAHMQESFSRRFAAHERSLLALYRREHERESKTAEPVEHETTAPDGDELDNSPGDTAGDVPTERRPLGDRESDSFDGGVPLNDLSLESHDDLHIPRVKPTTDQRRQQLIAEWEEFAAR